MGHRVASLRHLHTCAPRLRHGSAADTLKLFERRTRCVSSFGRASHRCRSAPIRPSHVTWPDQDGGEVQYSWMREKTPAQRFNGLSYRSFNPTARQVSWRYSRPASRYQHIAASVSTSEALWEDALNSNRTLLIIAAVVLLAIAGYFYWDSTGLQAPGVPGATTTEPAKPK
jgi:hypothetical protein